MKCRFCGTNLPDDARFCSGCGREVEREDVPANEKNNNETEDAYYREIDDKEYEEIKKKKKEEVSVAASIANSAAQDERNSRQGAHYNTSHDSHDNKEDFTIHSAEEARRAIIWGEILQRKY